MVADDCQWSQVEGGMMMGQFGQLPSCGPMDRVGKGYLCTDAFQGLELSLPLSLTVVFPYLTRERGILLTKGFTRQVLRITSPARDC